MSFFSLQISGLHLRTLILGRMRILTADSPEEDQLFVSFVNRDGEMQCVT